MLVKNAPGKEEQTIKPASRRRRHIDECILFLSFGTVFVSYSFIRRSLGTIWRPS
jgi:hypothetical protein